MNLYSWTCGVLDNHIGRLAGWAGVLSALTLGTKGTGGSFEGVLRLRLVFLQRSSLF